MPSECSGYHSAFHHFKGDIQITNMNTSNHKIAQYAAYGIQEPLRSGIMNFTTVSNSSSSEIAVIYNYGTFNISNCNYLNNEFSGNNEAIIFCTSLCAFSNCSFIRNKGNFIFSRKPYVIDHCYSKENEVSQAIRGSETSIDPCEPIDLLISHYSTYYCQVEYNNNNPNLGRNKQKSLEEVKHDNFDLKEFKIIVKSIYKITFCQVLNII